MPIPAMLISALCAASIIACGGESEPAVAPLSSQTATEYSANASVISADASSALDATLSTASQLVQGMAGSLNAGRKQALATSSGGLSCAAGGQATMTVSGASPLQELNGRLDAGEVYQIAFVDCRGTAKQAVLNGNVTMTVVRAGGSSATVTLSTKTLNATLPRGMLSFIGSADVRRTVILSGAGSEVTTRVTASSLTITTDFNSRTGNFTLSDVDLTRQASYSDAGLQSTSYDGTHSLAGVSAGQSFEYTVATQGGATYNENGIPMQGAWVITLPHQVVTTSVAEGTATIAVGDGKEGNIDRSFSVSTVLLTAGAG
jgi:hypothetical protein